MEKINRFVEYRIAPTISFYVEVEEINGEYFGCAYLDSDKKCAIENTFDREFFDFDVYETERRPKKYSSQEEAFQKTREIAYECVKYEFNNALKRDSKSVKNLSDMNKHFLKFEELIDEDIENVNRKIKRQNIVIILLGLSVILLSISNVLRLFF